MSSSEMVAQTRFYGMMFLSFCVPLRWLAGKTHELGDYPEGKPKEERWGTKSLGRVADHLLEVIEEIISDPSLFISEEYMMRIFDMFKEELPPFKEYCDKYFVQKKMMVVNKSTGMRVAHIAKAKNELWNPRSKTNQKCTPRLLGIVKVAFLKWKEEMLDEKKATYYNLSISGDKRSFRHSSAEDKALSVGCYGTNDLAESALGGVTRNIQEGGVLGVHRAAAESDARKGKIFSRNKEKRKRGEAKAVRVKGSFHTKLPRVRKGMVRVGMIEKAKVHKR